MRLAFHFDSMHNELGANYGWAVDRLVFPELLDIDSRVISEIVAGDLLFGQVGNLKYDEALERWFRPPRPVWTRSAERELTERTAVYAICFESMDPGPAELLHTRLDAKSRSYFGAMEVDHSYPAHWALWSTLSPRLRVDNRAAYVFWEGYQPAGRDESYAEHLRGLGFDPVTWEARV